MHPWCLPCPIMLTRSDITPLSRRQVLLALVLTSLVLSGVAAIWIRLGQVDPFPIDVNRFATVQGIGIGLGITGASALIHRLWPAYRQTSDAYMTLLITPLAWIDLIWVGVLPGVTEEFLFRGVALAFLGQTLWAIGGCSLIFGALHLIDWKYWPYGTWVTVIGIVLSLSLVWTGNLWVPILAHITTNLLASLLWKIKGIQDRSTPQSLEDQQQP